MKDLSPDARAMLDAVRDAHAPSDSDRDRVRRALARRLAAPAAAAWSARAALAPSNAIVAKVAIAKTLVGLVVAGSVAASVYSVTHGQGSHPAQPPSQPERVIEAAPREARSSHLVAPQPAAPSSSVSIANEARPAPIAVPDVPRTRTTTAVRPHAMTPAAPSASTRSNEIDPAAAESPSSTNTLGAELALVRGAQDALRDHDAAAALTLLDRHAVQFPFGVLREERSAARVLALCALERIDAAREEAARLFRSAPSSPQVARVRASCAGETGVSVPAAGP